MFKVAFVIAAAVIATTATAQAKTCKAKVVPYEFHVPILDFEFSEDLRTASVSTRVAKAQLIGDGVICGKPTSADCTTTDLSSSGVSKAITTCPQSDSHASIVFSTVNQNGRIDCRVGSTRLVFDFYNCQ